MNGSPEHAFFMFSPDCLCTFDLQGNVVQINAAMAKHFNLANTTCEVCGVALDPNFTFLEFIHPDDQDIAQTALQNLVTTATPVSFCVRDKYHQVLNWRVTLQPEAPLIYAIGMLVGSTTVPQPSVDRLKQEFVTVMNHELRTPLTSIHGSLKLLASGQLATQPEKRDRLIQIAAQSSDRLVQLVNQILDFKQLEAGESPIVRAEHNVAELMTHAVEQVQSLAQQMGVQVALEVLHRTLWMDRDRLLEVLTQLLHNAIQFSSPNSLVTLTAEHQPHEILFQVCDQGCGIPTHQLEQIFNPFHQVDSSNTRRSDGSGLGLALCREIVQQHAGRIWVESQLGKGSCFVFTIPLVPH